VFKPASSSDKYRELGIETKENKTEFDGADPPLNPISHGF
jgi:hypothetical protein